MLNDQHHLQSKFSKKGWCLVVLIWRSFKSDVWNIFQAWFPTWQVQVGEDYYQYHLWRSVEKPRNGDEVNPIGNLHDRLESYHLSIGNIYIFIWWIFHCHVIFLGEINLWKLVEAINVQREKREDSWRVPAADILGCIDCINLRRVGLFRVHSVNWPVRF